MKNYQVHFTVDGHGGYSITVYNVRNSMEARRQARYEIEAQAGYAGKRINVGSVTEIK